MTAAGVDLLAPSPELVARTQALAGLPSSSFDTPAFVALREYCHVNFPGTDTKDGLNFALGAAIDRLGLSALPQSEGVSPEAVAAARRLERGFAATHVQRTYLSPLDLADDFADIAFGPIEICELTLGELQARLAPLGPMAARLDPRLARFRWLIVRETVALEHTPGRRALPWMFETLDKDYAQIEPHKKRFPNAVEEAIFALLLAPWEDLVSHADLDWRPFRIPWVYTVDEDLFVRSANLPSADGLSWEPDFYTDRDGETVEVERPLSYRWHEPLSGLGEWLNNDRWSALSQALGTDLFSTPVVHFLVSAFLTDDIDEFIGHLTTLEAALGLREDSFRERTLGARVEALLQDTSAAETYRRLFNLRSEYVHGRPMTPISGAERNDARRLARRIANALVDHALTSFGARAAFLHALAPSRPSKRA